MFSPIIDLIELAGAILIIALGTWALAAGDLTIGGLLAFLAYLAQLYRPVRDLSRLGLVHLRGRGGAERVIELLDTEPRVGRRRTRSRSIASPRRLVLAPTALRTPAPARPRCPGRASRCGPATASPSSARAARASPPP